MMKKLLPLALVLLLVLLLAACAAEVPSEKGTEAPAASSPAPAGEPGYMFESKGVSVHMGQPADPYIAALGDPIDTFEAPSCAFEGIDRIYYYPGFELYTFPKDGADYVLSVSLTDDSVTTKEGIYLGCSIDDVVAAYSSGYTQNAEEYTYQKGDAKISFLLENGVVASIRYRYSGVQ